MNGKILIIKTGHAETFGESTPNDKVSLGDILRTTILLNFYSRKQVDWLTTEKAFTFIKGNDQIDHMYTLSSIHQIQFKNYELIINLEKFDLLLEILSPISQTIGFIKKQEILFCKLNNKPSTLIPYSELNHNTCYNDFLCQIIGQKWLNQSYCLGYQPTSSIQRHKIGFNWKVGPKWPEKQLQIPFWKDLSFHLNNQKFHVSWQEGFNHLENYIDWIYSCDHLITLDSLGLHLAIALKKPVIALFATSNPDEIYIRDNIGHKLNICTSDTNKTHYEIIHILTARFGDNKI